MPKLPTKTRHYTLPDRFGSHFQGDMTEESQEKKALSIIFLQDFISTAPKQPRIVSSAEGSIDRILFTIPDYAIGGDTNPLWKVYQDLIKKLPTYTQFTFITHESSKESLLGWLREQGLEKRALVHTMADHLRFTVWAEDAFVVVNDNDSGRTFLVEPHSFPRSYDELIGHYLSEYCDLENIVTPLYFQGGNVLIGDNFYFIGADYPVKSLGYLNKMIMPNEGETRTGQIYRLYREYFDNSKRLHFIGSALPVPTRNKRRFQKEGERWNEYFFIKNREGTVQPLFHIDMFMSMAGRGENGNYRILVGDPRLAAQILEEPVSPYAMAEIFDHIAKNLTKLGFEVIRNPLPLIYVDDEEEKERDWYFATANNCLVEIRSPNDKTVWLPTYGHGNWAGLVKTDNANRHIWEQLGFKVILLEDFHPFAENSGSVHCIKKYLARGSN
jgi:hypothetical protein